MKPILIALAAVLASAMGAALLYAWLGIYNVGAIDGHWAITRWFLHFGLRNSIETHAIGIDAPPLDDPSLFHKGLSHYQGACAPCHGTPGETRSPVADRMLPVPPHLASTVATWKPRELFWIVKNGLKYTGMPAWIAQNRDDEVWAVVAFLRQLPDLSEAEYRDFSRPPGQDGERDLETSARLIALAGTAGEQLVACARCHGLSGEGGGGGAFPRLAGQKEAYLYRTLRDYASGARPSGLMQPVAAALSEEETRRLAAFYAGADFAPDATGTDLSTDDTAKAEPDLGENIALNGIPERGVPPCTTCHGADASSGGDDFAYPTLDGQFPAYLSLQLRLWRDGRRGGGAFAEIMTAAARGLSDADIQAVSAYYAARPPGGARSAGP